MAILIHSTEEKKIEIPGADIELSSLYLRIEFAARVDGKTVEVAVYSFKDKSKFKELKPMVTNVPTATITKQLNDDRQQSVADVHELVKQHYEGLGYKCEIVDL